MFVALFADGGSRGNPGPSAYGFFILEVDTLENLEKAGNIEFRQQLIEAGYAETVALEGLYIGVTTNNQAEWQGLVFGLEAACKLYNPADINLIAYLDSELVVKQVRGEYKVKKEELKPWSLRVKNCLKTLQSYKVQHVYREHNKEADKMVNSILDQR